GAFAVMPADDRLTQALVLLFAVGMSVSAVSCYSAYRYLTMVSMALALLPCTLWLLFQPSKMQLGMAIAVLVFSSFVVGASRKLSEALETAFRLTREIERAHSISTRAAQTDELTGLMNRRAFFDKAQVLYDQCQRTHQPLCALMLDMDHFKAINDTYGHLEGDQVLLRIAESGRGILRRGDLFGRIGGEEFAAVLPGCAPEPAIQVAERLGQEIQQLGFSHEGQPYVVTVSQGLASLSAEDTTLDSLFARADAAMYEAKRQGKNRVIVG
ncbi:GGDEF domain-containing protein, partial [Colwellia sp. TT2012]|uniref:GGDEF domain-containing protein n=1 Tax=Colwellia sp. TT2012 TaxID=1720342 RepID=UPI0007110E4C